MTLIRNERGAQAAKAAKADDLSHGVTNSPAFNWRRYLAVHPAAELFPLLPEAELRELAEDIEAHGLQANITVWSPSYDDDSQKVLLDGRNRLDALARLGLLCLDDVGNLCTTKFWNNTYHEWIVHDRFCPAAIPMQHCYGDDPYRLALSFNIHRRHLTGEQKRDLIAKLLKANPEQSNRSIAKQVKEDHHKVAKVRSELESTGEVSPVEKTVGADGKSRKQPAKKPKAKPSPSPEAVDNLGGDVSNLDTRTDLEGREIPHVETRTGGNLIGSGRRPVALDPVDALAEAVRLKNRVIHELMPAMTPTGRNQFRAVLIEEVSAAASPQHGKDRKDR